MQNYSSNSLICYENEAITSRMLILNHGMIFQDPKIANAIQIVSYITVVSIVGQSYRIKDHFSKEND